MHAGQTLRCVISAACTSHQPVSTYISCALWLAGRTYRTAVSTDLELIFFFFSLWVCCSFMGAVFIVLPQKDRINCQPSFALWQTNKHTELEFKTRKHSFRSFGELQLQFKWQCLALHLMYHFMTHSITSRGMSHMKLECKTSDQRSTENEGLKKYSNITL